MALKKIERKRFCELCQEECSSIIYDTVISGQSNAWAYVCTRCNVTHGITHGHDERLGVGVGQKYEKKQDGTWVKVAG